MPPGGNGNGGGQRDSGLPISGSVPGSQPSNPERSANNGRSDTFSEPKYKGLSEGWRPLVCGAMQTIHSVVNMVGEITSDVLKILKPIQDRMDPFQDRLYNAVKDTVIIRILQQEAEKGIVENLALSLVLDMALDVGSFVLGHDLLTGEKLSHGVELLTFVAIAIPVLSMVTAKATAKLGGRLLRRGVGKIDELAEGVKFAAKHADDLQDAAVSTSKHLDDFYDQARALNFPDRVTESIVANLKPGRQIAIELSELSDGTLGLKRAALSFDEDFAYKHINLKGAKSDSFGLLFDEDYVPHLSDPDIMVIIDDGRILSDQAALQVVDDLNYVARGNRPVNLDEAIQRGSLILEPTDPFQHSQRASFYEVSGSGKHYQLDADTGKQVRIADSNPRDGVAVFELDKNGNPTVYTVGGKDEYVDWVTSNAYNTDLSYYPWASKNPGGNPSLDWNDWYNSNQPPNRIYSTRELNRRVEAADSFHNFPGSFDEIILSGKRTVISDNYTLYTHRGTLTTYSNRRKASVTYNGTYEIGVRPSSSGRTEVIMHRFFNKD